MKLLVPNINDSWISIEYAQNTNVCDDDDDRKYQLNKMP